MNVLDELSKLLRDGASEKELEMYTSELFHNDKISAETWTMLDDFIWAYFRAVRRKEITGYEQ